LRPLGPRDDREADVPPGPQPPHPGDKFPSIRLIRPDETQAGNRIPQDSQEVHGPSAVLHTGGRDRDREQEASRVHAYRALAPVHLLVRVVPVGPPCSVVLTDWLSMIPARG
jgi:hypothetical protein